MVTIKDVADRAHVSMTTVSRAFNPKASVSRSTRSRVQSIAKQMGYIPNINARGLVTRRTYIIGVFLSSLGPGTSQSFLSGIINAAYMALPDNYLLSIVDLKRLNQYKTQVSNRMDGMLIVSQSDQDDPLIKAVIDDELPLVVVNREVEDPRVYSICSDDASGVRQAVNHVYELGHRRLGMIEGMPNFSSSAQRRLGFDLGIQDHHEMQALPSAIRGGDYSMKTGQERMSEILALPRDLWPTCMVCANDDTAIGAMRACSLAGLEIPGDMSFVGFDDSPYAEMVVPALTTVRKPVETMIGKAITRLMGMILDGDEQIRRCSIKIRPDLIKRESVSFLS